jgi:hypothetical protein
MNSKKLLNQIIALKKLGGHPRFYELLLTIAKLHADKNHDYSADKDPLSNLRECEGFGVDAFKGTMVRLSDKWSRLKQLSQKEARVKNESIMDTLMDMSVYSLLAIVLLEEENRVK